MNAEIQRNNARIAEAEANIELEAKKLREDKQAIREQRRHDIDAAKAEYEEVKAKLTQNNDAMRGRKEQHSRLQTQVQELNNTTSDAEKEMKHCDVQLQSLNQSASGRANMFGKNVQALRAQIDNSRWHGEKPIGPLGAYVSLVDPKWRPLLQSVLGNLMTAFAITDGRDRNTLKRLLSDSKK